MGNLSAHLAARVMSSTFAPFGHEVISPPRTALEYVRWSNAYPGVPESARRYVPTTPRSLDLRLYQEKS